MDSLEPLLRLKNHVYDKCLSTGHADDHRRLCGARAVARRAVKMAKISWYQQKVKEAQQGRFGGKVVWRSIRDMQRCHQGLRLIRSITVKDQNGRTYTMTTSQHQRWRKHVTFVLNIQSHFTQSVLDRVEQRPLRQSMADLPSMAEMLEAVRVPQQWSGAILVPVPKKGDLSQCDNWRGISLLDMVGKMVAGIGIVKKLSITGVSVPS